MSTSRTQTKGPNQTLTVVTLPRVTVQHDISTVIEDVRDGIVTNGWEDVWVSCYRQGNPGVHGKVRISKAPTGVSFEARDGIEWHGTSTAEFQVACPALDIPAMPIRLPKHVYTPPDPLRSKKITAFDVSPDGILYATGHADGSIVVSSTGLGPTTTTTSPQRHVGTPHLSTVLSLRFFPSSTVLLSSSADLSIRIHDATTPTSTTVTTVTTTTHPLHTVRTLQAHTAGVTGTAIVDRGRNVLSFGRDGTARLWDVGGGREIVGRRWRAPRGVPILCGCLGYDWAGGGGDNDNDNDNDNDGPVAEGSGGASLDGEVGTSGKVVFVGMQDGSVRGYELSTGRARFFSSGVSPTLTGSKTAPIDSMAFSAENRVLVVGRRDGVIMLWDLTAPSPSSTSTSTSTTPGSDGVVRGDERDCTPTSVFTRNGAGIESLAFSPSVGPNDRFPSILVGAEDGLFCRIAIDANGVPKLEQEFVGGEAGDGVRVVRALMSEGREVDWSAGDDGCVRRY